MPPRRSRPRGTSGAAIQRAVVDAESVPLLGHRVEADDSAVGSTDPLFTFQDEEPILSLTDAVQRVDYSDADFSTIFREMRQAQQTWVPESRAELVQKTLSELEWVPRIEEEQFLREPYPNSEELACRNGPMCQGVPMPGGVPLVEHHSQRALQRAAEAGQERPPNGECIMCKRYNAGRVYFNSRGEGGHLGTCAGQATDVFQPHCNYVDQEGEYCLDQVISTGSAEAHGIALWVVIHCMAWYELVDSPDGIVRYSQTGYRRPSDFR